MNSPCRAEQFKQLRFCNLISLQLIKSGIFISMNSGLRNRLSSKRCQFHQYFSIKQLLYKNVLHSSYVNFINILRAAFRHEDPKSTKKTDGLNVFFALIGICACKTFTENVGEINLRWLQNNCLACRHFFSC